MPFVPDAESRFVPDKPSAGPLPANAGLANFGASVAGIPVDTVENVVNLGLAGAGTLATAAGRPDLAPDLLRGSIGGSEHLKGLLRRTGEPGLNPDNPSPGSGVGTAQYDFMSRGGFIPGGAVPAAGSMIAEKIGGPAWAGVGSLLPSAAISGFNELRSKSLQAAEQRNIVRDSGLKDAHEAGYKVPASQVNPTFVGNRLESVAGKAALNQEATIHNQGITDGLARKAASLPEGAPITEGTLAKVRSDLAQPYREVASLSSRANYALETLKDARFQANAYWKHYDRSADPSSLAAAKNFDAKTNMLENLIEKEAASAGRPELAQQLRQARVDIAKNYQVERALNLGDGTVDARVIARAADHGAHLTGELSTIAKFALGPGAKFTRSSAMVPTPGVSAAEPFAAAMFGSQGSWLAAGLPLVRGPVRSALMSDWYQNKFARPDYAPAMTPENPLQSLGRLQLLQEDQLRR